MIARSPFWPFAACGKGFGNQPDYSPGSTMMSMLKVIEVLAESDRSWEDAAQNAVTSAAKSLHGIKSIYIKEMEATVEDNRIKNYRINAKISFILD
jgi:hypothetical protein